VIEYALNDEEARVAASRAAWRASLSEGLLRRHLAPLAAFVLIVLFAGILGWTGLIARRAAEFALLLAAAAYMIHRLWTRRRFFQAQRAAAGWAQGFCGEPSRLTLDENGFSLDRAATPQRWRFADGLEIEATAGLIYVWPKRGEPLVWPQRAHADAEAAEQFLALARRRAGSPRPAGVLDDDD
jgi:hypothetical protein